MTDETKWPGIPESYDLAACPWCKAEVPHFWYDPSQFDTKTCASCGGTYWTDTRWTDSEDDDGEDETFVYVGETSPPDKPVVK